MMIWSRSLITIRNILGAKYPDKDAILRFVEDAGIDPGRVTFSGSGRSIWRSVLERARGEGKLAVLLKQVCEENPAEQKLHAAVDSALREGFTHSVADMRWSVLAPAGVFFIAALTVLGVVLFCSVNRWRAKAMLREVPQGTPIPGMVLFPGGIVMEGSTREEVEAALNLCKASGISSCEDELFAREQPAHEVLVQPFYLDAYEVTNAQFAQWLEGLPADAIRQDGGSVLVRGQRVLYTPDAPGLREIDGVLIPYPQTGQLPVTGVSWYGADQFCRGRGGRLPTEAEWEFAARGGPRRRRFPWGSALPPDCGGVALGAVQVAGASARCPDRRHPSPVGSSGRDRTDEGVSDLGGNVREWVADTYAPYPRCACALLGWCLCTPIKLDAAVQDSGDRVLRGGSWASLAIEARGADRSHEASTATGNTYGFRCARDVR